MNPHVFKTILIGAALGAALFLMPFFLLKVVIVLMIFGFIFRVFGSRRYYRGPGGWAYADKIRGMSDDEYSEFKTRWSRHGRGCGGYHRTDEGETAKDQES